MSAAGGHESHVLLVLLQTLSGCPQSELLNLSRVLSALAHCYLLAELTAW